MQDNVLLVGNGAREHAIALALAKSRPSPNIFAWMKASNPGIRLVDRTRIGSNYNDIPVFAKANGISLAVIGPEEPLKYGVADALEALGIPTVGSMKAPAQLETSKAFIRALMDKYGIPGCPKFKTFRTMHGVEGYLKKNMPVVLKPDGLTGGKGVMVQGEHFNAIDEALKICQEILAKHGAVVIEEKLEGEEFSLQCFCDGANLAAMPPVQDHKRRLVGDRGLNTGGMGSYSCANHLLPFLTQKGLDKAMAILRRIITAVKIKTGCAYRGIIYGGFMITAEGIKLIEINARFGDPEAMNVLSLLETDFMDICRAITTGTLNELPIKFTPSATVCKYLVPLNYGLPKDQWVKTSSDLIQIGDPGRATLYYSSIFSDAIGGYHMTSSRAVAVLGMSPDLAEAEKIAEKAACAIKGAVAHREDVGTAALVARRVRHLEELRKAAD